MLLSTDEARASSFWYSAVQVSYSDLSKVLAVEAGHCCLG